MGTVPRVEASICVPVSVPFLTLAAVTASFLIFAVVTAFFFSCFAPILFLPGGKRQCAAPQCDKQSEVGDHVARLGRRTFMGFRIWDPRWVCGPWASPARRPCR